MAFMDLPNEILEQTIIYALPEGFEGLALTCKLLHALCTPFIAHHNKLRFHFRNFEYCKTDRVAKSRIHAFTFPYTMGSAYNLIEQIAVEPTVASYIQDANFELDSHITQRLAREFATDESRDGDVIKLLANSSYLREAGLDWKQYHTVIEEDLNAARYSQHAAAFVLTLLPNLKTSGYPQTGGRSTQLTGLSILSFICASQKTP